MFSKNCFLLLVMGFFMLFYMPSWAAVFCVDPGGNGTHNDLQNALTDAETNSEDDTIKVVKGLYNGNFTYDSSQGDSLVLEGGYDSGCGCREVDPESTVLQGGGSGSVLYIKDSAGGNFTVDGFTLKNGGGGSNPYGGGLRASSKANSGPGAGDITIQNNIIEKNSALTSGGGIYAESFTGADPYHAGNITLINNIITGNRANNNYGGGVFAELYANNASIGTITLLNNTIHGNKAQYGGGAYLYTYGSGDSGIINFYNNIITGNTVKHNGADIYLSKHSGEEVYCYNNNYHSISDTRFQDNVVKQVQIKGFRNCKSFSGASLDCLKYIEIHIDKAGSYHNVFVRSPEPDRTRGRTEKIHTISPLDEDRK